MNDRNDYEWVLDEYPDKNIFILDTLIAHRIYKSRAGKYGDVLTVFTVLSLGLLRPVFLFAVRNRAAESVPAPECGN